MKRTVHDESEWIFPFIEYSPVQATGRKLPLIVRLHGAGERGNGGDELIAVDRPYIADMMSENEFECILVLPQCPHNSFWAARIESILAFIEQIKAHYDIDEERISMTGVSMGGYGTWFTAMARPDIFSAIAPICGGGMAWNAEVLDMPIWTFHGTEDATVSCNQTEEMVEALIKYGADVKYTRLEGYGHGIGDVAHTKELWEWLISKRRPKSEE